MLIRISKIYSDLFHFLKNPDEDKSDLTLKDKWRIIFLILLLDFAIAFSSIIIINLFEEYKILKLDYVDIFIDKSFLFILILAGIIIPIFEEFIFRFPLTYQRNYFFRAIFFLFKTKGKIVWNKYYKFIFYSFALIFALIHLTNYNNNSLEFFLLTPFIVLSQFVGGLTLGYTRLKLGLIWSILQHSLFNSIIFTTGFLFFNVEPLINIENNDYYLKIEHYQIKKDDKLVSKFYRTNEKIDSVKVINADIKSVLQEINLNDSIVFNEKGQINLTFKRKENSIDSKNIINSKLKEHFDFEVIKK